MAVSFLKKSFSVKRMLHQTLAGEAKARGYNTMHASSLTQEDFCARKVVLLRKLKIQEPNEFIGTALWLTFQQGNDFGRDFAETLMGRSIVGNWKCRACGQEYGFMLKPYHCAKCGAHSQCIGYEEVRFYDPTLDASCGVDALLSYSAKRLLPIELKTIDKDLFKPKQGIGLVAPKAEHKQRTALYLNMIARSDHPHKDRVDTSKAVILYKSKSFGFKDNEVKQYPFRDTGFSPFKEFNISCEDHIDVTVPEHRAKVVKACKEGGFIPDRCSGCSSIVCAMAKSCAVSKQCYSGDFPVTLNEGDL